MKIGMKVKKDVAENLASLFLGSCARAACAIAHGVRTASFASTVTWLGVQEGDENWHEGGDGHCRRNDIFGFGIARAQRGLLSTECAQRALQAPLPC